jgi:hypothetical protein
LHNNNNNNNNKKQNTQNPPLFSTYLGTLIAAANAAAEESLERWPRIERKPKNQKPQKQKSERKIEKKSVRNSQRVYNK